MNAAVSRFAIMHVSLRRLGILALCSLSGTAPVRAEEGAAKAVPAPSAKSIATRLEEIRFPTIDFADTSLEEAIDVIRLRTRELDPAKSIEFRNGVNFVVQPPDPASVLDAFESDYPHIGELRMHDVRADELLRDIGDATGTRCRIDDCAVVFLPASRAGIPREKPMVDASPGAARIAAKLRAIRLPVIGFQDTRVEEAVDFLRLRARELDYAEPDAAGKGVDFVLLPPAHPPAAPAAPGYPRRIKELRLRDVPVDEAIHYLCEATGMRYRIDDRAVTLLPAGQPEGARDKVEIESSPEAAAMMAKLNAWIIPQIEFEDLSVAEAVDFFRLWRLGLEIDDGRPQEKPQNITIRKPATDDDAAAGTDPGSLRIKELRLRNVPEIEAICYVCELTGLKCQVNAKGVVLIAAASAEKK